MLFKENATVSIKKRFSLSFFLLVTCGPAWLIYSVYMPSQFDGISLEGGAPIWLAALSWLIMSLVKILGICVKLVTIAAGKEQLSLMRAQLSS